MQAGADAGGKTGIFWAQEDRTTAAKGGRGSPGRERTKKGIPKFFPFIPLADRWTMSAQSRGTASQLKAKGSERDRSCHPRKFVVKSSIKKNTC